MMRCFERLINMKIIQAYSLSLLILSGAFVPTITHAEKIYSLEEIGVSYGYGIDVGDWLQVDFIQHVIPPLEILKQWLHEPYLDVGIAASKWKASSDIAYHMSANLMVRSRDIAVATKPIFFEAGFGPHIFSKPGGTGRLATAFEFN